MKTQRPDRDESPGEPARKHARRQMPHLGPRIARVDVGVQHAVERHGDRSRRHHCHHDPAELRPQPFARKSVVAPGQQRSGERERQREHGVLELDHFERQPDAFEKGRQYYYSKGMRRAVIVIAAVFLCACGEKPTTMQDLTATEVTLPNGVKVMAQSMRDSVDMVRGLMFRDSLAPDRGALFFHGTENNYPYFTFQYKIPVDILWLDHDQRIVEIVPNVPPCPPGTPASTCPAYGGHQKARYVLQVNAGFAAKNDLRIGERLDF